MHKYIFVRVETLNLKWKQQNNSYELINSEIPLFQLIRENAQCLSAYQ